MQISCVMRLGYYVAYVMSTTLNCGGGTVDGRSTGHVDNHRGSDHQRICHFRKLSSNNMQHSQVTTYFRRLSGQVYSRVILEAGSHPGFFKSISTK